MTREQCEAALLEKLKEAVEIYKQYEPNCEYLIMSKCGDLLSINNEYWSEFGKEKPLSCYELEEE